MDIDAKAALALAVAAVLSLVEPRGEVVPISPAPVPVYSPRATCPRCKGDGLWFPNPPCDARVCPDCKGEGVISIAPPTKQYRPPPVFAPASGPTFCPT